MSLDHLIVHSAIIHELRKAPEMAEASVLLSQELLPITERALDLIGRLDETFERKNDLLQGYLPGPDEGSFAELYNNWTLQGRKREPFAVFTSAVMQQLANNLQGVVGARGGYLLFADYTVQEQRLLGVYMIRNTEGYHMTEHPFDDQIELDVVYHLDIQNMAMAARIMVGVRRNVQMIRHARSQSSISQYFTDWVGIDRAETSSELTYNFLELVEELPVPKDRETGFAMNEGDFEKALSKYAANAPQQIIRVRDFDAHFYGNEQPLQERLNEENESNPIADGFRVDKKAIRQRHHLAATQDGIKLACTKDHLRSGLIHLDEEKGSITIHSEALVALLLNQYEH